MSKEPLDVDEVRDIFAAIVAEDNRAGDIIRRLRTMLRRGEVAKEPVSVNECLEDLLRLIRSDLDERGIAVTSLTTGNLPPAMTDRVQLQQVMLNLIMNACDAMESNPPDDRNLILTTLSTEEEVRIGVLDCGVGLPHDIDTLFQPFHSSRKDGMGMGLSICHTLVTAHGGRIWAERREDRGAAFYVGLPLATNDSNINAVGIEPSLRHAAHA
jgi:C4-dicarboxylate-specific signal transduction histidine kinase